MDEQERRRMERRMREWVSRNVIGVLANPPALMLVERPGNVPDCADLHEAEDGTLTWRWVEQTIWITDDGAPPALAERLDDLYGAAWRCAGMGT